MRKFCLFLALSLAWSAARAKEPIKHMMLLPEVFVVVQIDEAGVLRPLQGGALGKPVLQTGSEVQKGVIQIRLGKINDKDHMIMVVQNGYDRPVMYRAWLQRGADQPRSTSVCPIRAGLMVFGHWPYLFDKITVGDFRFLDEKADMTCQ